MMKKINLVFLLTSLISFSVVYGSGTEEKKDRASFLDAVQKGDNQKLKKLLKTKQYPFSRNKDENNNNLLEIAVNNSLFASLLASIMPTEKITKDIDNVKANLKLGIFYDYINVINSLLDSKEIPLYYFGKKFNKTEEHVNSNGDKESDFLLAAAIEVLFDQRWYHFIQADLKEGVLMEFIEKVKKESPEIGKQLVEKVKAKQIIFSEKVKKEYKNIIKKLVKKQIEENPEDGFPIDYIGVNSFSFEEKSPLLIATSANNIEVVNLLLSSKVANAKSLVQALSIAVENEYILVIKELIRNGADPSEVLDSHKPAIYVAAFEKKSTVILKELLKSDKTNIMERVKEEVDDGDSIGKERLNFIDLGILKDKEQKIMNILLEAIDEKTMNKNAGYFILSAIRFKNQAAFNAIVKRSQKLNPDGIKQWYTSNAKSLDNLKLHLSLATQGRQKVILEWLISNITTNIHDKHLFVDPLVHEAITSRQVEILDLLLKKGANPNSQDSSGYTPLYLAVGEYENDKEKSKKWLNCYLNIPILTPIYRKSSYILTIPP